MKHFGKPSLVTWTALSATLLGVAVSAAQTSGQDDPATKDANPMAEEAVMKFAERFDAIFQGPKVAIADDIFAPDFVGHVPLAPELDRDGWKNYVTSFYSAIPDLTEKVNEVIIGEDRVVLYVTYSGRQTGPLFGVPATGKAVLMNGIGIFRFHADGRVAENWAVIDVVGLLAQIGAFPPTQAPAS